MAAERGRELKFQKSYFDVLGLCCSSEVPLIEKILQPLEGIEKVSVIVPTRTVIVVHNNLLISQIQIVKVLNQARLEANVRVLGEEKSKKMWPSPYTVACGVLLLLSIFKFLYHPMHWLALAATVVGLPPIVMRSIAAVRRFTLDVNILMLIAVGGAIALRDYWEAASIVFLFTIAEWLESRASHKATAVMSTLMSMAPQKAVLAENGQVVDARDVKVDTVLAVKAGEVIPIDGIVVEGKSEVDERTLTGESFPVTKQIQSRVWAGTMNLNGYISVKTTALAEDSAVARMAKLVEEAQQNKSKMQKIVDKCAKYYTPAIVLTSIGLAVVPTALRVHNVKYWYHLALVILVSACPCALILSTPTATFCALSQAATIGLLIKGGDYLEALTKTKIVAFDKTGTITRGEFTVTDFRSVCDDISLDVLLYWVASIESKSSHPMAAALVDYGRSNGVEPRPENVVEFQIFPGEGIYGEIDGKYIYVGNKRIAARAGCETVSGPEEMKEGITVGYVFSGATMIGTFGLSDTCRSGVAEAIAKLKSMGIKTAMLTGDSRGSAMHIQKQLEHAIGIVHAELLPEDKVTIIKELKKEGPTAMVGDGMNDAPALATADVGISMGISGSAVATETGHVTLMSNDIRKIPQAIELSFMTRQKIIQNVGLSIVTKVAIVVLAFSGHPLLWAAILADVGTCLLVIFNSMLILRPIGTRGDKCSRSSQVGKTHKDNSHKCCGSSTRVEHAKGTCGPVHCHLTHAHRRTCSQSRTPSTCENDKHGACGTTSHAQFKSCVKDDTCSSQVHVHCHGKDDDKGNGQTCDRGSCGSTSHAQFKSCVKDDTCSSHMHIHHHENHDDTGNGHTCDHETDEHTSCSNKDQNDTCTSSTDQIHPCLQLSTHTEHENENDHHDHHDHHHHDHHHHDHHHQHQSSKCDRSEEKVSTCESKNLHHCPHVVDGAHVGDVHDRCASSTVGDVHGTCASSSESGMRRCCQPRDVTAHLSQIVIN